MVLREIQENFSDGECYHYHKIIRVIKSRSMRLAENVARMGEVSNEYSIFVAKPERKRQFGRPRLDGR
jgi:hypothetical protein